jgi:hypothetical protein
MAKIAEILLNKASLREVITSVIPFNTNGVLKKTEKGYAVYLSTTADLDGYGDFSGVKSIVFACKPTGNTKIFLDNGTDKLGISGGNYSGTGLTENTVFIDSEVDTDAATYNLWQLVISEFSAGINFATDLEIDPTANIYLGFRIILYDHILSQEEKNELYIDFLAQKPLGQKKQNFHYEPPHDLSRENGIVAAYNMIPSAGGVLADISGNGNNGTIDSEVMSWKNGMRYFGNGKITIPYDFSGKTKFTLHTRIKRDDETKRIDISQYQSSSARVKFIVHHAAKVYVVIDSAIGSVDLSPVSFVNYSLIYDGSGATDNDKVKLYINGILQTITWSVSGVPSSIASNSGTTYLGYDLQSMTCGEGVIQDVRIYDKVCAEQEAIDYHNKFAEEISFYDNFNFEPADGTNILPKKWLPGTGSFKISELSADDAVLSHLTKGNKVLECTSAGTLNFLNTQAYGTLEFDFLKQGVSDILRFILSSDRKNGTLRDYVGYRFVIGSSNQIGIVRDEIGSTSVIMLTLNNYIGNQVFYRIKIIRSVEGQFTLYIKGGAFGNSYQLVSANTGTNPGTDNNVNVSKYSSLELFTGSKIANIKYTKGIKQ